MNSYYLKLFEEAAQIIKENCQKFHDLGDGYTSYLYGLKNDIDITLYESTDYSWIEWEKSFYSDGVNFNHVFEWAKEFPDDGVSLEERNETLQRIKPLVEMIYTSIKEG